MSNHLEILKQNGKSFYWAGKLLPKKYLIRCAELYSFCRLLDDIADTKTKDENFIKLNYILDLIKKNDYQKLEENNVYVPSYLKNCELAKSKIIDLIHGLIFDQKLVRIKSEEQLILYCYRVAGTVGLMTQNVMGIDSAYTSAPWSAMPDPSEAAIALGIANQLTNILRDVGEDRQRGRIYLPQADFEKFNYSEEELLKGKINKQWKALMNFQLRRAREWFQKSEDGIKWLSSDARWPVWTSLRLYRGILDSIERLDYDVFNNRAFVKKSVKALEIPISFLISRIK